MDKEAQALFDEIKRLSKNKLVFTFTKTNEHLGPKPDWWERAGFKEREHYNAYMMGSPEGRNLISTAIAFFLKYAQMSPEEKVIAQMYRDALFNCLVKEDRGIRKEG